MKKIQHLKFDFSDSGDFQQPLYCPFSGEFLVISDPLNGLEEFPKTVISVFNGEGFEYVREDFNESELENFDEIEELLPVFEKKLSKNSGVLIFELGYYGSHTGDYGAKTIFLEVPNVLFINNKQ
jgi:hypothetical protein